MHFYSGNQDEEEEEDQDEMVVTDHTISNTANDLYDNYANTGLMSTQETPKGIIGSETDSTNPVTSSASYFDNENLTKGNQIPDYNNVGDYDLSLDDKNTEEIAAEEKQQQDRASYDKIVRHRIPAINENYRKCF